MVMGVVESRSRTGTYPELEGARVLITGLEARHGVDIARAFAEAGCRLVLQTPRMSPELEVVLEVLAQSAEEVRISEEEITSQAAALRFTQGAMRSYGGLEAVINLARLDDADLACDASAGEIEDRLVTTMGPQFRITEVAANRMQVTWTEGLILNIVTQSEPTTEAGAVLGRLARAALASLTRQEAERWADGAVRVNAIVPSIEESCEPGAAQCGLSCEPEIAALALHLTGSRGRSLSGLVFDTAGFPAH
jgi:NAD(P)-dependent dehydrogenase (short-subunit alcohol dehydrogenase family)